MSRDRRIWGTPVQFVGVTALCFAICWMTLAAENDRTRLEDANRTIADITNAPTPTVTETVKVTLTPKPAPTVTVRVTDRASRSLKRTTTGTPTRTKQRAVSAKPQVRASRPVSNKGRPTGLWLELAKCESGARLTYDDGTYQGAYNFLPSTWRGYTHGRFGSIKSAGWPEQTYVAWRIFRNDGWSAFPGCGRKMHHPTMPPVSAP